MCSRRLLALGASLISAACFDIEQVDVLDAVRIDDFEDGDQVASNGSGFSDWYCFAYSAPEAPEEYAT